MIPDLRAVAGLRAELEQLERDEVEISAYRRRLHERIDRFPSEAGVREERQVSDKRRALHRRIDELREQLADADETELNLRPSRGTPAPE